MAHSLGVGVGIDGSAFSTCTRRACTDSCLYYELIVSLLQMIATHVEVQLQVEEPQEAFLGTSVFCKGCVPVSIEAGNAQHVPPQLTEYMVCEGCIDWGRCVGCVVV